METEQIVLAERPEGVPSDETFRTETVELSDPQANELQVQPLYISVDPYLRGRMNDTKSYVEPFKLDEPLTSHIVAKVVQSQSDDYSEGDMVVGQMPWMKMINIAADKVNKITNTDVPLYLYLSVLGMPGQTGYQGLLNIGKPQEGETVVVSAASGAVGSVVGQIAKIKGDKVVGIAGGPEKVNYLTEELNFDEGVDYKADDFAQQLENAVPDGVDVYYENVGGPVSDEVFKHLNTFARIPVCGTISNYNDEEQDQGPRLQSTLIKSQALMQGFVVAQFSDHFEEGTKQLAQWVQEDKIKTKTSVVDGFENIPEAFRQLFTGDNFGKQVVKNTEAF